MSLLETVMQNSTAPHHPWRRMGFGMGFGGSFIFGAIGAVSVLLITIGVFYVLIKLGRLLDAMKTEAGSAKK